MKDMLIVHHYDASPYCEKIRLMLGHKQLEWQSVLQPMMLPKDELQALTGGYRRVPVLQCGADIHIDSAWIARVLEQRYPDRPSLFGTPRPDLDLLVSWADSVLFWAVVKLSIGQHADQLPAAFLADRAAMAKEEMRDARQAQQELLSTRATLARYLDWLEHGALAQGRFLQGDEVRYHDYALYHCLWFLDKTAPELIHTGTHPRMVDWMARVAATGHGTRHELGAHDAIAMARDAEPRPFTVGAALSSDPVPGTHLSVRADSNGVETMQGTLLAIDADSLHLEWISPAAGKLALHLPRLGYSFNLQV